VPRLFTALALGRAPPANPACRVWRKPCDIGASRPG
jgi:hypothetical protein